jgi:hypothetical protein
VVRVFSILRLAWGVLQRKLDALDAERGDAPG